jgi:hypothetical protein
MAAFQTVLAELIGSVAATFVKLNILKSRNGKFPVGPSGSDIASVLQRST